MLMLSGVLKQVVEHDPGRRFNLIRRTNYGVFLASHPAIARIGYPPKKAKIERVDYWSIEKLGPGTQRPFQVLARAFGLQTPVEENLYIPPVPEVPFPLLDIVPWTGYDVLIAPGSDSPRKVMAAQLWHHLVDLLHADGAFVLQGGRTREVHIRNAYSVMGLTTPRQFLKLLARCSLVITSDSFTMHAAHHAGVPTVALWGPTHHLVYGYPEQLHLQAPKACGLAEYEDCIGPERNEGGRLYSTPCSHAERHCLDQIRPEAILTTVRSLRARG